MEDEKATAASAVEQWDLLSRARFTVGPDDQLAALHINYPVAPNDAGGRVKLREAWLDQLSRIRVKVGTLLKTDTVSFLLGAGASVGCGGVLIGEVPREVEETLHRTAGSPTTAEAVPAWLHYFYLAAAQVERTSGAVPTTREGIGARSVQFSHPAANPLPANYESLLAQLWRWRSTLADIGGTFILGRIPNVEFVGKDLDTCIRNATDALASHCVLPTPGRAGGAWVFEELLRKVLTRPLNLKRASVFTLNYDTLVEQAADASGVVLIDGFIGTLRRIFRPECYDQDLYFPAQTTEGRVHRLDRVAHLYKLHGSISWRSSKSEWDNPFGVRCDGGWSDREPGCLIYPTPAKFGETMGMPYAELFRRFASCVSRPQSTLIVIGYGFGDEHVNAIVRQALLTPSFTLVVVDPNPGSAFVKRLEGAADRRVWMFSGETLGTLAGFVNNVLPDLKDEDVRRKVVETYRSLDPVAPTQGNLAKETEDGE